ncbi:hypothetical protein ABTM62_19900, partial [Acinetobacter baumannii]
TKCFERHALDILCCHSGARIFCASPESIATEKWIPGLRQAAHPGMTGGGIASLAITIGIVAAATYFVLAAPCACSAMAPMMVGH